MGDWPRRVAFIGAQRARIADAVPDVLLGRQTTFRWSRGGFSHFTRVRPASFIASFQPAVYQLVASMHSCQRYWFSRLLRLHSFHRQCSAASGHCCRRRAGHRPPRAMPRPCKPCLTVSSLSRRAAHFSFTIDAASRAHRLSIVGFIRPRSYRARVPSVVASFLSSRHELVATHRHEIIILFIERINTRHYVAFNKLAYRSPLARAASRHARKYG